jgi:hypothetical protein
MSNINVILEVIGVIVASKYDIDEYELKKFLHSIPPSVYENKSKEPDWNDQEISDSINESVMLINVNQTRKELGMKPIIEFVQD